MQLRRLFILYMMWILGGQACAQDAPPTVTPTRWPGLRDVQWATDSFWGQRQCVCYEKMLPSMTALMDGKTESHFLENFRIAAGTTTGKHRGPAWNDGDTYKWLEALSAAYAVQPNPATLTAINSAIDAIAAAQRADGYLHTPALIAARNDPTLANTLSDPSQFEMYNFGHLMTAACTHFEATGERRLLEVALKAADYLDNYFANPNTELARHAICPAHYMGLIDLYRTTRDERWLKLAIRLLDMRDLVQGGDDNQDRIPFREQREAVGHAVRANYLYAGAADLMIETRDSTLWPALDACWRSVQTKKIYITGGCGALFDGASPDGSKQQSSITRIHQAYGRNYQLPNATAHNETCAAIGNVLWNARMWQLSHAGKYIDALETSLMNAVLAGVSLDGERFFYTNTLRQLNTMPVDLRWSRQRQAWISCYCCPPNVARTIASMHRMAYATNEDGIWVLLYGSNRFKTNLKDGEAYAIEQKSQYPFDGLVELTIEEAPARPVSLHVRIPGWCSQVSLERNGRTVSYVLHAGSFFELKGPWKKGDTVRLNIGMPIRLMQANPLIEECRGQVAVQRGPLVYCLESVDLPGNVQLMDVSLVSTNLLGRQEQTQVDGTPGKDSRLKAGEDELKGITTIQARFVISTYQAAKPSGDLYSDYQPAIGRVFDAQLIPYFAWGNRGKSEMTVWLPLPPDLTAGR